jgi:hypothetical protein
MIQNMLLIFFQNFWKQTEWFGLKLPRILQILNPKEMIWADMKKHLASKLCKTLEELK